MSTPYPTPDEITSIFKPLSQPGQGASFFAHVVDDVDWTILGHSPMSGHFTSKSDFQAKTLGVLNSSVLTEPLAMHVVNVVGGGESDQAVVEMMADRICRNGLKYDMTYCWVIKFNKDRKIAKVRAYIDTDLLTRALRENGQ